MKYHTVYKITNLFNNKIYIGYHSTNNLDDGYMGSGLRIKRLVLKYGKDSFKKDVLHIFENEQEMIDKEIELLTPEFLARDDTYNIVPGGGSFDSKSGKAASIKLKEKLATDIEFSRKWSETSRANVLGIKKSAEHVEKMRLNNLGKILSEEQKQKISSSVSKLLFVNKDCKNTRILPELLNEYLSKGWVKGRYMTKEHMSFLPRATGKIWFHSDSGDTILRYKSDTASLLSEGWKLGRKPSIKQ